MKSLSLFLVAIAAAASLYGEDKKSDLNATDEKFVKQTAESGMAEVKLATLGSQKAERADVKEFASMLVTDHTTLNGELATLAQAKKVELSAVISPKAAETFKDLEMKSGADFDKAFLTHMEKAHKSSVDRFEDAQKDAADSDLKGWVSKTLPTLKAHLDKVKGLRSK